jgi:hypothetical protein
MEPRDQARLRGQSNVSERGILSRPGEVYPDVARRRRVAA